MAMLERVLERARRGRAEAEAELFELVSIPSAQWRTTSCISDAVAIEPLALP